MAARLMAVMDDYLDYYAREEKSWKKAFEADLGHVRHATAPFGPFRVH